MVSFMYTNVTTFESLIIDNSEKYGTVFFNYISPFYYEVIIVNECNATMSIKEQIKFFVKIHGISLKNTVYYVIIEEKDFGLRCSNLVERYKNMLDKKNYDIEVTNDESEFDDYSDDSLFNITSWGADLSFRELIMMYDDEDLIKPELQRKYVWNKDEASKFIDSLLLGLPVPSIFLAKVKEQHLIIDGYQRIMTVYDYCKGVFSGDKSSFKLSNSLAINERWRGKTFAELDQIEQKRIRNTTIHAIIFEQKRPANDSGMYKIFERINTSGRNLKPQEIRNCVYHGKFNTSLMLLNVYDNWRKIWGSIKEDSRMLDVEFILRFFALDNLIVNGIKLKQISLKKELNNYMAFSFSDKDIVEKSSFFKCVVDLICDILGEKAFRNLSSSKNGIDIKFSKALHPAIYDAVMLSVADYIRKGNKLDKNVDYMERYITLLNNEDFKECISIRTTNADRIIKRVELAKQILFNIL